MRTSLSVHKMTTKVYNYRIGAIWTAIVVLSHCAAFGIAAPAGTMSGKTLTFAQFHYRAHTHLYSVEVAIVVYFSVLICGPWWMLKFYKLVCTFQ